jgi:GAF domain-containing protein
MEETTEGLEGELTALAGLLLANETLQSVLQHVAYSAVRTIPACDAAGVSLAQAGNVTTAAVSDELVTRVDQDQYDTGEGPCLDTLRTGEARRSPSLDAETRWPSFTPRARAKGVKSCLSIPLVVGNHGTAGALNLYATSGAFGEDDEDIGRSFATPASVAVANARAYAKAQAVIGQLHEALESRDVIGQAKGIIRVREGCTSDEAFERLRTMSQHRNIKLHDIARAIVDTTDALDRQ